MSLPAPRLRWIAALAWFAIVAARAAAAFHYDVDLVVPAPYRALLADNLEIMRWRSRPAVDLDFLRRLYARAPAQIAQLLATDGFYSPRVRSSLYERNGTWTARFVVDPGPAVTVSAVHLDFSGAVTSAPPDASPTVASLRAGWPLHVGARFRQAEWEAAKRELLRALVISRYPAARISASEAVVDPAKRSAVLHVTVDSGPVFYFGKLEVTGLSRYPRRIIDNLSPIHPGDVYSQAAVLALQTRLQDSGYFRQAVVTVPSDPAQADAVPIEVAVTEEPSKKIALGGGYSTDTGPRGSAEYDDLNIRGRGWRLTNSVQADRLTQIAASSLNFPIKADGARDSVTASYSHTDILGDITRTYRLGIARARRQGALERVVGLQYINEDESVAGAPGDTRQALAPSVSWTRRAVDNPLYPHRGYLLNLQLTAANQAILSDQSFVRIYSKAAAYYPIGTRDTLIARGELGAVQAASRAGIPSDFLFRTGGDRSVRGYAYQSLGVHEGDAIVGGRYLAVGSVEYDHWFLPNWGGAVFYDRGNAADSPHALHPVAGYGLGARWRSPIGPVNLDIAYGEALHAYRVHFAVGFVF